MGTLCQSFQIDIPNLLPTFGHTNPSTDFMDHMKLLFRCYLDIFLIVFIEDILIYSKSENDHTHHLRIDFQTLKDNLLFPKFGKCEFWLKSVAFLGHIFFGECVEVNPKKTYVVKSLKL